MSDYQAIAAECRQTYAEYQAVKAQLDANLHRQIRDTLAAGGTVTEYLGSLVKDWRLGSGPFLEPFNSDPNYLAEHLMNRRGFGTRLEFPLGGSEAA